MRLAVTPFPPDRSTYLEEGDPLPPDDRVPLAPTSVLDDLYRTQFSRLMRFFARSAGRDEAHDLVQEAFARFAGKEMSATERVCRPEAYLSTVATNLLRDRARNAARRAAGQQELAASTDHAVYDPHKLLEDRETLARLEIAVGRMGRRRRRIFLLHRLDHLTYEEIAEEVGMSVKGVKKQMAKALFELRRDVGPL